MPEWLAVDEVPFDPDRPTTRTRARRKTVTLSLRGVHVLDNRKLFGSARVRVLSIVVDGNPDEEGDAPFWRSELDFPNVRDGAVLPIDPEFGYVVYRGKPWDFVSVFVMIAKDTEVTRQFAKALKESFLAEGIGAAAGVATVFAGAPMAADAARKVTASVVDATLDVFSQRKNPLIATYYGSVTRERKYGAGLHPAAYPGELIDCGGAAQLAYEIVTS
jgi:hypothetical protein